MQLVMQDLIKTRSRVRGPKPVSHPQPAPEDCHQQRQCHHADDAAREGRHSCSPASRVEAAMGACGEKTPRSLGGLSTARW
jgi:hypothetical protein